jgi:hypothetical protein
LSENAVLAAPNGHLDDGTSQQRAASDRHDQPNAAISLRREAAEVAPTVPRREVAVVAGALMLLVFPLGFVIEGQGWGLAGTIVAGLALVVATTTVGSLTLLLHDRRRDR